MGRAKSIIEPSSLSSHFLHVVKQIVNNFGWVYVVHGDSEDGFEDSRGEVLTPSGKHVELEVEVAMTWRETILSFTSAFIVAMRSLVYLLLLFGMEGVVRCGVSFHM